MNGSTLPPLTGPARRRLSGDTGLVTPVIPQPTATAHPVPSLAAAELDRLNAAVTGSLQEFLERQRTTLAGMDAGLVPLVDEVAALAAGGRDNGAPGPRPEYHPGYYGAFVLDPDGNNIEAVFHGANPDGTAEVVA